MNDFEEKLESILGNPQAMEQIMSLARSLDSSDTRQSGGDNPPADSPSAPSETGGPGTIDPALLAPLLSLLSGSQGPDDKQTALLQALRPFVSERRYAKLDKAIQIARLSRLIRMALELFRTKEDSHV